jgi:2-C-methyl-D-erythritol 4-phosphate cytidylyltransferase / 2-C-methyl-D-erythritol 2,4-cyclodiphosphate synthase
MSLKIALIILSAGRGERMGGALGPKQYRILGGGSVIKRCLQAFDIYHKFSKIIIVHHIDDLDLLQGALGDDYNRVTCVVGSDTRQKSARNGLIALENDRVDFVLIHDAARPFVSSELLGRILTELSPDYGILPVLTVVDTLKKCHTGFVQETVDRKNLFAAQTPQAFPYAAIYRAHQSAQTAQLTHFTDDASIFEWAGFKMKTIEGCHDNVKLTTLKDMEMNEKKLNEYNGLPDVRCGHGYDVHSFVSGDHVTLCGVKIPYHHGLNGHSDSDVALHALTDALLATVGAGDIGTHFPPSDMQWRGADSKIFVEFAVKLITEKQGKIANVDITLICEEPKIGKHREAMVNYISEVVPISSDRISIKATTNEKLGFIGRNEGIAALSTVSVVFKGNL